MSRAEAFIGEGRTSTGLIGRQVGIFCTLIGASTAIGIGAGVLCTLHLKARRAAPRRAEDDESMRQRANEIDEPIKR